MNKIEHFFTLLASIECCVLPYQKNCNYHCLHFKDIITILMLKQCILNPLKLNTHNKWKSKSYTSIWCNHVQTYMTCKWSARNSTWKKWVSHTSIDDNVIIVWLFLFERNFNLGFGWFIACTFLIVYFWTFNFGFNFNKWIIPQSNSYSGPAKRVLSWVQVVRI
jgi:hypothetical protein